MQIKFLVSSTHINWAVGDWFKAVVKIHIHLLVCVGNSDEFLIKLKIDK